MPLYKWSDEFPTPWILWFYMIIFVFNFFLLSLDRIDLRSNCINQCLNDYSQNFSMNFFFSLPFVIIHIWLVFYTFLGFDRISVKKNEVTLCHWKICIDDTKCHQISESNTVAIEKKEYSFGHPVMLLFFLWL